MPTDESSPPSLATVSLVVRGRLRVSTAPAAERHPYGYGKADAFIHIEPARPEPPGEADA